MNIDIIRIKREDRGELEQLFYASISGAFTSDGIESLQEEIKDEVTKQLSFVDRDLETGGRQTHYLIARIGHKIAGVIASGPANDKIVSNLHLDYAHIPEIKSVYVLPEFQGQGVGSALFKAIVGYLKEQGVEEFVLDGGYKKSQKFWRKKLGVPVVTLKDYWGKDFDHLIWHIKVSELV